MILNVLHILFFFHPISPLKKTRSSIHKKRPTKNSSGSNRLLKSYFGLTMVNRSKLVIVVDISLEASEQCVFDKKKKSKRPLSCKVTYGYISRCFDDAEIRKGFLFGLAI
jgi:hypothetical protein